MQSEKINKYAAAVFWILTAVCMGVIFWLSSRTADESSQQSADVLGWLTRIFGDNIFTTFIVRKSAHFLEYTGLCLLFNASLFFTKGAPSYILSVLLSSVYAVSDEVHQIFVDGRSCQISDWAIDTCGAVLGAVVFMILLALGKAVIKRKKPVDTSDN